MNDADLSLFGVNEQRRLADDRYFISTTSSAVRNGRWAFILSSIHISEHKRQEASSYAVLRMKKTNLTFSLKY
ncbi:hypothetical protein [Deinococcus sp. ME38]|uniref:hypothetical protein n=1 Tax=Deinococcus sp. ME38 TaxID=3400344 RepID=UPI003B59A88F